MLTFQHQLGVYLFIYLFKYPQANGTKSIEISENVKVSTFSQVFLSYLDLFYCFETVKTCLTLTFSKQNFWNCANISACVFFMTFCYSKSFFKTNYFIRAWFTSSRVDHSCKVEPIKPQTNSFPFSLLTPSIKDCNSLLENVVGLSGSILFKPNCEELLC